MQNSLFCTTGSLHLTKLSRHADFRGRKLSSWASGEGHKQVGYSHQYYSSTQLTCSPFVTGNLLWIHPDMAGYEIMLYRRPTRLDSRVSHACRITRFLLHIEVTEPANVGRVAGWIESAHSLGTLTGLAPASYLADSIGRKPTAISGVVGASIATVLFGFGKTVPQLVLLRYMNGFFVAMIPA
jgi:MFS family permease